MDHDAGAPLSAEQLNNLDAKSYCADANGLAGLRAGDIRALVAMARDSARLRAERNAVLRLLEQEVQAHAKTAHRLGDMLEQEVQAHAKTVHRLGDMLEGIDEALEILIPLTEVDPVNIDYAYQADNGR